MESDESDNIQYSDDEIDGVKHEQLVENVLNLTKVQQLKKPSRTEPTLQVSEFNLVKSITGNKGSVYLNELTKSLKNKKHVQISQKLQSASKRSKTLPKPLEKPQAERIRRSVAYERSRLEFDKWEAVVTSNRAASHLSFPLGDSKSIKIEEKKSENYINTWRVKSDLERELEKLDNKVEEYHIDTEKEKDKFSLSMKELMERRKEAAKLRAHQSYKEAKARQQNKIKSKKYHRIQRRERIRQKLKEFEELQKTNPEEALRKLEDIEKARAEERFSLRHRGTGQWAKNKQIRAKYDKETRQVLAQQLAISRELTQKLNSNSDSEDERMVSEEGASGKTNNENNPWVSHIKPGKDVADFVSDYRKFWNEHNKTLNQEEENCAKRLEGNDNNNLKNIFQDSDVPKQNDYVPVKEILNNQNEGSSLKKRTCKNSTSDWEVTVLENSVVGKNTTVLENAQLDNIFNSLEDNLQNKINKRYDTIKNRLKQNTKNINKKKLNEGDREIKNKKIDLTLQSKSKKHLIDEELMEQPKSIENSKISHTPTNKDLIALKNILNNSEGKSKNKESNIDPNKFMQVKTTNLNTAIPDILTTDENEENDIQRNVILEAFEDDDVIQEFEKEKANEIEKDKPKDIDLNLPGWGSWGGTNIKPNKRKQKRFIIKMPEKIPRKDDNKGTLIINERAQSKIKPHMVSEIPFPFKTVKDFEASIRAPIGNTFVPETAYKKLIQPPVTTKLGTIIKPMSRDILIGKKS